MKHMRIVLIIQSLIILAGSYYVYTLTRPATDNLGEESTAANIEIKVQGESEANAEDEDTSLDEAVISEGHNDLGMEFPMPDNGDNLESR